ncbi:SufE family protein [Haematospirillum sp. H1815]|uniref:SufE family protein n=1 Tax=Haematospirillum sp. H1815 TaxID=2723108 RepID=UPI001ADE6B7C|nr:SufE family protein [Haematospirillum sp. H1815]
MGANLTIDELVENFSLFDDWEDRYRYIIDLGRTLEPFPEESRTRENKVEGCISQVWLTHRIERIGEEEHLFFTADSDAHIVKGLLAVLLALFSGKTPKDILSIDADAQLARLELDQHISPNRRNGVASVVQVVRSVARDRIEKTGDESHCS